MTNSCSFLARPDGRIAFDVAGAGPLVILIPGMGDLRSTYRHVADELRRSGFRVATTDLRGHGDSDATFAAYGDVVTAGDVVALVEHLGRPAILVGNSMGAAAAVYAAAERPDLVAGLVLIGPFVRESTTGAVKRALFRAAMAPWWAATVWRWYLPSLYAGRRPEDLDAHLTAVSESLRRPGYARAFVRTTRTSHASVEARLDAVGMPVLVLMGTRDPDFPDPRLEAEWIAQRVGGRVVMIDDAGHYPQSQQPQRVLGALAEFLASVLPRA